ncbi:hypothetical protein LBMAG53_36740 [Planctomycetota bacterium]|nr:hypothetical protein LBMAG53_36740 [Planctomycetota bacterium]
MARFYRLLLGSLIQCIGLIPLGLGALALLAGLAGGLGGVSITVEGNTVPWWFAVFVGLVLVVAGVTTIGYGLRLAQRLDPLQAIAPTAEAIPPTALAIPPKQSAAGPMDDPAR